MPKQTWNPHTTVLVCGVQDGTVTSNGTGNQEFKDLHTAREVFPELDPAASTDRFTWALGDAQKDVMRFETWAANDLYST